MRAGLGWSLLLASACAGGDAPPVGTSRRALVSPELTVPVAPVQASAHGRQHQPRGAFGGDLHLVVWVDERTGGASDIYGARLTPQGALLDPTGIPICDAPGEQHAPDVAGGAAGFLAVWGDSRNPGNGSDVYGARVSPSGEVLDRLGLPISAPLRSQFKPRVAYAGGQFLVAWIDDRDVDYDVRAARVAIDGGVLDPEGIPLSVLPTTSGPQNVAVAGFGSDFFVAWSDGSDGGRDIFASRVFASGAVAVPNGAALATRAGPQDFPEVAAAGNQLLVAWEDWGSGSADVIATRVTAAGLPLDVGGIALSAGAGNRQRPAVGSDGTDYLVAWQEYGTSFDVRASRVSAGGLVGPAGLSLSDGSGHQTAPALAPGAAAYLWLWEERRNDPGDVAATWVTPTGEVESGSVLVSTAGSGQGPGAVAFDGRQFLVVWEETRGAGGTDILGARVSAAGFLLDQEPLAIASSASADSTPAVASDGAQFLVVWVRQRESSGSDLVGARVFADGGVGAEFSFPPAGTYNTGPAVVSGGTQFLVCWQDGTVGTVGLYAARVSGEGVVLDSAPIRVSVDGSPKTGATVAANGQVFLVAWERFPGEVEAARVSPEGALLDPAPLALPRARAASRPSAAFAGGVFFVAWQDGYGDDDIYGARITSDGTLLDVAAVPIFAGSRAQRAPAVAAGEGVFHVVWEDGRSAGSDLYFARVEIDGGVAATDVPLSTEATDELGPAIASNGAGRQLVVYSRFDDSPAVRAPRLRARMLGGLDAGVSCERAAQCASGYCADGVCCDAACEPCGVCTVAAGAAQDGVCEPRVDGLPCPDGGTCQAGACRAPDGDGGMPPGVRFLTQPAPTARCGVPYLYRPEIAPADSQPRWRLEGTLAAEAELNGTSGELRWAPPREHGASRLWQLEVTTAAGTARQAVEITVACAPRSARVGCGCGHGAGPVLLASLLLLAWRGLVRRRAHAPRAPG